MFDAEGAGLDTDGDMADAARETGLSASIGLSTWSDTPFIDGEVALLMSALVGNDIPDLFVALWNWATRAVLSV